MDRLLIEGGKSLSGTVRVSGAKNAALPAMAAALLASGRTELSNVPGLQDVRTMGRLLSHLGAEYDHNAEKCSIDTSRIGSHEAPYDLVKTMRASVLVLGPLAVFATESWPNDWVF